MGLLDVLTSWSKRAGGVDDADDKYYDGTYASSVYGVGRVTATGMVVTPDTAMRAAAVYACVRVLTESVASLPIHLYERLIGGGKDKAQGHPLYSIVHDIPNPEMTAMEWRETVMNHLCLRGGNHYSEIERRDGRPVGLWPLNPDRMKLIRVRGKLWYLYMLPGQTDYQITPEGGAASVERVLFDPSQILHIKGLSSNGLMGYSPIAFAAESIGLSLAATYHGSRFFSNDATPGGVLEHPGKLRPETHDRMKKSWQEAHGGLSKSHRVAILEEGMKFAKVGLTNKEAQFLETRKFQRSEIAGIFRVPPHMIGDLEKATFSNIEHQGLSFTVHTIRPWLVRIEQAMNRALLFGNERYKYFIEHVVDGLLRGDIETRYNSYAQGRQNGWLSADDVREKENMNPLPDNQGKIYMVPLNMVPASSLERTGEEPEESIEEERKVGASLHRVRLAKQHYKIFQEAIGRVIRFENKNVSDAIKKYLKGNDVLAFNEWRQRFYFNFGKVISLYMNVVFDLHARTVCEVTTEELNSKIDFDGPLNQVVSDLLGSFREKYIKHSCDDLTSVILTNPPEMLKEKIEDCLREWKDTRVGLIAGIVPKRIGDAIALKVYSLAGISKEEMLSWKDDHSN